MKATHAARRSPEAAATPLGANADNGLTWLWASLGVFAFGVLVFANTLGHGFVWDDSIWLEQKIRFYRGPADAFFEPTYMPMRQVYRPLSQLTYWIDQSLWWRNPFGFHLTSVLLHATNGVLVLALARTLGFALVPAVTATLLFVAHPIQPQSVAWITNRVDVLATLFVLLALLAALRPSTLASLAIVAFASFGAAASKETGCVVPLLVAATSLLRTPPLEGRRPVLVAGISALGVLPYFALRPPEAGIGIPLASLDSTAIVKLAGSLGYQVERLTFPVGFWPYFAHVPTDGATIALALSGTMAAAVALAWPDPEGRRRFATAWIVVASALPVVVVLADFSSTPVAEHRLYLATVGVALLVATAVGARPTPSRTQAIAAAIVLLVTAVTTHRNRYWHDDLTLWTAVTERLDTEPLPYLNLGLALAEAGRPAEAEAAYRRGLTLGPNDVNRQRLSINLGLLVVEQGKLDEAASLFMTANGLGGHAIAYRGLALVALRRAQAAARAGDTTTASTELTRALANANQALAINPRYYQGHATLARILYDAGRYRDALASYQHAATLAGDSPGGRQAAAAVQELSTWLAAHPETR